MYPISPAHQVLDSVEKVTFSDVPFSIFQRPLCPSEYENDILLLEGESLLLFDDHHPERLSDTNGHSQAARCKVVKKIVNKIFNDIHEHSVKQLQAFILFFN